MSGLQDLLMLRQLRDQADPFKSAMQSLAQGVGQGIETARTEAKASRKQQEQTDKSLQQASKFIATNGGKLEAEFENGKSRFKVIPKTGIQETKIPKGFRIKGYSVKGEPSLERDPSIGNLEVGDKIKARNLARKLYGVRGAEKGLPDIISAMEGGKSIDEVEDMVRFSGQSEEFTGAIRDAAQSVFINSPIVKSERAFDYIDDQLSKGNITSVKNLLKKSSRDGAGVETSNRILGKERTVEFLDEIQNSLNMLEESGVDTNIFTGTVEDINKKIGRVKNPRVRKIATEIKTAIMNYRRSMSGAAFSVPESKEYSDIFPSISRTSSFNRANLDALKNVMGGDLKSFYSLTMGRENYDKLFSDVGQEEDSTDGLSDEDAYKVYLQTQGAR